MNSVPPAVYLLLAVLCSLIGRIMLVRAASGVGRGWALSVLLVPLAPLVFRLKHKAVAQSGSYWRLAVTPLAACFFLSGGGDSLGELQHLQPWARKTVVAPPAIVHAKALPRPAAAAPAAPEIARAAEPEPAAPVTIATLTPPVPVPMTLPERVAANQQEFARLGEVYEGLKRERGYLRKGDQAAVEAYNVLAAKYQQDLAKARVDQTELMKLVAKK